MPSSYSEQNDIMYETEHSRIIKLPFSNNELYRILDVSNSYILACLEEEKYWNLYLLDLDGNKELLIDSCLKDGYKYDGNFIPNTNNFVYGRWNSSVKFRDMENNIEYELFNPFSVKNFKISKNGDSIIGYTNWDDGVEFYCKDLKGNLIFHKQFEFYFLTFEYFNNEEIYFVKNSENKLSIYNFSNDSIKDFQCDYFSYGTIFDLKISYDNSKLILFGGWVLNIFEKKNANWILKDSLHFDPEKYINIGITRFSNNQKQIIYCSAEDKNEIIETKYYFNNISKKDTYIPMDLWVIDIEDYKHIQIIDVSIDDIRNPLPTPDSTTIFFLYQGSYYRIDDLDRDGIWTKDNYFSWEPSKIKDNQSSDFQSVLSFLYLLMTLSIIISLYIIIRTYFHVRK